MNIYSCCFNDDELKAFINQATLGDESCGYSHNKLLSEYVDLNVLKDFFSNFINLYEPSQEGVPLVDLIKTDWNFFAEDIDSEVFLDDLIANIETSIDSSKTKVKYNHRISREVNHWETFTEEIKFKTRFLVSLEEFSWDGFFSRTIKLNKDMLLYRARLHFEEREDSFPIEEMKCPPIEKASSGRANPLGIPYLYLSTDAKTTLFETRATYLDDLSIASFKSVDGKGLLLVDFTEDVKLFNFVDSLDDYAASILLKRKISKELSKPLRRYDSELEYIPTQFICEYIKIFTEADGIVFNSSLYEGGKNIVLFYPDKVEGVEVKTHKINEVDIASVEVR
jgi:hypothetical protein